MRLHGATISLSLNLTSMAMCTWNSFITNIDVWGSALCLAGVFMLRIGLTSSNQFTNLEGGSNLISECMLNMEVARMDGFDLAWTKLFWNRMGEVIRDLTVGPPRRTMLRAWLDRHQVISKGLLSNPIVESCRETCRYIVQGSIKNTSSMSSQGSIHISQCF